MNDHLADDVTAAYLASRKSAIATLGFDPTHSVVGTGPKADYTIGGMYAPSKDTVLTTGNDPSDLTHESFHRGLEVMRKAGVLPEEANKLGEESMVRAFMQRAAGMVERNGKGEINDQQVEDGKFYNTNRDFSPILDSIEAAAAAYRAKQTPGGPR